MDTLETSLEAIRESLLRGRPVDLGPEDGETAFERHILLAVRFHRAAGLNQTETGERAGWRQYFEEHFPKRPEWEQGDAIRLWENWRVGLVKLETPLSGVMITHGQPRAHWYRVGGMLCINLESMWDDFEASVESFLTLLRRDEERRAEAVRRWRERSWTVRHFEFADSHRIYEFGFDTSAASSATAMGPSKKP